MDPLPQEVVNLALQTGEQDALRLVAQRQEVLAARAQAFGVPVSQAALPASGILIAEGDSWFDYPWNDVLSLLEDRHGFEVHSVAHKGDRVEDMAHSGGQLVGFIRALEKLIAKGTPPKAVMLSGGGNDIAGIEFGMLLNHSRSAIAGLSPEVMAGVIDQRIRVAYLTILSAVDNICLAQLGRSLPILLHGYDYPVPDGRGFLGGWWALPGPWLEPGFRAKGYQDLAVRISLARNLIDRFNEMLQSVAAEPALAPFVRYVNLRGALSTAANYKDWWANELHPTTQGFEAVTARLAVELATIP
jgi:lysophospholipase L1-like esterase